MVIKMSRTEYMRQWRLNNPDKVKASLKMTYIKHRESYIELAKQWQKANPEKVKVYEKRKRNKRINRRRGDKLEDPKRVEIISPDPIEEVKHCRVCRVWYRGDEIIDSHSITESDFLNCFEFICPKCGGFEEDTKGIN